MKTKVTFALIAICIAVYALEYVYPDFITNYMSLDSAKILAKPWSLVTYMFVHADNQHIFYNMFGLFFFGMVLESIIGSRKFAMLYFASGIVSGIAGLAFYPSMVGASGAVFGIIGALAILRPGMEVWVLFISAPMAIAAIFYILFDMIGFFLTDGIAHAAHLAGMAVGIIYGLTVSSVYAEKSPEKEKPLTESELREWEDENMGDEDIPKNDPD